MLLILISWLYIFFTLAVWGVAFSVFFKLKNQMPIISLFVGLFSLMFFAAGFAFFFRLNFEFHIILLLLNILLFFSFKKKIVSLFQDIFHSIRELSSFLKICLTAVFLLVLAQSSTAPFVLDNESYYIQSIKWLNEYGFVKGLANLHLFFGQTSGWHVAQAAFNFNFLYPHFNDLSAFCLLLGNYFAITELQQFFWNKKSRLQLAAGFFPLGNLLFFQFVNAPSPDIPVIIISFVLFFYLLKHFESISPENIIVPSILCLLILFIKPTAIAIAFIPPFLMLLNWRNARAAFLSTIGLGVFVAGIFILKNFILTGYLLFPTDLLDFATTNWKLPKELQQFYYGQTKAYAFLIPLEELKQLSFTEKFLLWLQLPKLHGFFNLLSLLVLVVAPFFISKMKNLKLLWFLYTLAWLQLLILFFTSPQYRFFLPFLVFMGCLITAGIFKNERFIKFLIGTGILAAAIPLLHPISVEKLSQNEHTISLSSFSMNQIVFPHPNSRYSGNFKIEKVGNLQYYDPVNMDFFWGTGDGELPCVNQEQLQYFETSFNVVPQLRGTDLSEGFYSKKIKQ